MKYIIQDKLLEIEQKENVKIIMAVESGSRAWGFESPDSDYDVRFIYVRNTEDYLQLEPVRDVIEWQLDDTLDINGWDLKKALILLHKSNPTIFEWCTSPIIYKRSEVFQEFKTFLPMYFSEKKSLFHYWHMAESNYRTYLKTDEVRVKKYFYALRPILAAKWIMERKCPPPMLFSELFDEILEDRLKPEVEKLLEMKMNMSEMGLAPKIQALNDYIEQSMDEIKVYAEQMQEKERSISLLNDFFVNQLQ